MNHLSDPKAPIEAKCHCGAITVTAPGHPEEAINDCQCTLCRRYGAAWAYYNTNDVKVTIKEGASMSKYIWASKKSSFNWCDGCGCLMFWWRVKVPEEGAMMGLNSRMMEPDAIRGVSRITSFEDLFMPVAGEN